jgi:hypothetical protein
MVRFCSTLLGVVILHRGIHVFLGPDIDLLGARLILELEVVGVVRAPARAAAGDDAGLRLVGGQIPGRHLVGVIDAADDDRLVGIAFQEIDQHFLADAGNGHPAIILARPHLGDTTPAGAVFVLLAVRSQ